MRYIEKTVTVEAFRYDGSMKDADGKYCVPSWAEEAFEKGTLFYALLNEGEQPTELFVRTSYNERLHIPLGNYIIRDGYGAIGRLSPVIFRDIYEEWPAGDLEER